MQCNREQGLLVPNTKKIKKYPRQLAIKAKVKSQNTLWKTNTENNTRQHSTTLDNTRTQKRTHTGRALFRGLDAVQKIFPSFGNSDRTGATGTDDGTRRWTNARCTVLLGLQIAQRAFFANNGPFHRREGAGNATKAVAVAGTVLVIPLGAQRAGGKGGVVVGATVCALFAFDASLAAFANGALRTRTGTNFALRPLPHLARRTNSAADLVRPSAGIARQAIGTAALVGVLPRATQIAFHRTAAALGIPTRAHPAGAVGVVGFSSVLAFFAHAATAAAGVGGGAPHHAGKAKHLALVFLVKPTGAINADAGRDGAAVTTRFAVVAILLLHVRLSLAG